MKKLILPLLGIMLLAASCGKESDNMVTNKYYVVDGDYVFVDYITVAANTNAWQREIEIIDNTTHRTVSLYYECSPRYSNSDDIVIDSKMIESSYVVAYWLNNDYDTPLPKEFSFYDNNNVEHRARFSYVVSENALRIICESLDGDWEALLKYLNSQTIYFKYGCHIVND